MEIYIVQPGDNIISIANRFGISVERLISDNGLINPYSLVVGQALVILYPDRTYTVQQGDTLSSIAESNGISLMQLLRSNPFLYDREYIIPGESLVINYNTTKDIEVNGYSNVFTSQEILSRALPYLTYISVNNYRFGADSIISYGDDTNIIRMAKEYSTIPLFMISALSPIGELEVENVYRLLLDTELFNRLINEALGILRTKEYMGINLLISNITTYNQSLYIDTFRRVSEILRNEGYIFMVTISPDYSLAENLDYQSISQYVDRIIFFQNIWTLQTRPPAPISNISLIKPFIEKVTQTVSPRFINLGKPLIGYDWVIPFQPGTRANLMSLNSTILLAYEKNAVIQFDEVSQTPYFEYIGSVEATTDQHKVWFVDSRSIAALDEVVIENDLIGTGIWNVSNYNRQLFSITNATFNIVKLLE